MQASKWLSLPQESAVWVVAHNLFGKFAVAFKLFILAIFLGNAEIGLVALAYASLGIAEGISDTGISSAIVNYSGKSRRPLEIMWTLNLLRGFFISCSLIAAAAISSSVDHENLKLAFLFVFTIPVLRSATNPGYFLMQKNLRNQTWAKYEISIFSMDIVFFIAHSWIFGMSAFSPFVGTLSAELIRLIISWKWEYVRVRFNNKFSEIRGILKFSLGIWATSSLTVLINQIDKYIVLYATNLETLGSYFLTVKIAQIAVADPIAAFAQYLFPRASDNWRKRTSEFKVWVTKILGLVAAFAACLAATVLFLFFLFEGASQVAKLEIETTVLAAQLMLMASGGMIAVCFSIMKAMEKTLVVVPIITFQLVFAMTGYLVFLSDLDAIRISLINLSAMWASAGILIYILWHSMGISKN